MNYHLNHSVRMKTINSITIPERKVVRAAPILDQPRRCLTDQRGRRNLNLVPENSSVSPVRDADCPAFSIQVLLEDRYQGGITDLH